MGADRRPGFHRYHSGELVTDLDCGQLPVGMLDGLVGWTDAGSPALRGSDDDGERHVVCSVRQGLGIGPRTVTNVVEGAQHSLGVCTGAGWRVPVTALAGARDAAAVYSDLIADWVSPPPRHDHLGPLRCGAAAVLCEAVGESDRVLTVDTSRLVPGAARAALVDFRPRWRSSLPGAAGVIVQPAGADLAVLDPPRL